jgi:sterol 3beta-glucosyltransferase
MKITIFCAGTRGDIQPLTALGVGLQRHGHRVTLATSHNFETFVTQAGLVYAPLTADYDRLMRQAPEMLESGMNVFRGSRIMVRHLSEMVSHWAVEGRAAAADADLVIGQGPTTVLAGSMADALNIPVVQAQLQPMTPCTDIRPMVLPPLPGAIPGAVNLALYYTVRWFMWSLARPPVNNLLRKSLDLEPYSRLGPLHRQPVERRRVLYGYSERILPRSRDWPQNIQVTGFWFLDAADDWRPPDDLVAFLAAGPKPIYVGFGSMYPRDPKRITATVMAAIRKAGCRAIIARGWGGLVPDEAAGDPNIYLLQQAPHDWLFPRMAAAVHHGGAGTTAAAVRAGIPSLILPFITEQAFWSVQLEKLGVAAPRLNRHTVTADQLASGITRTQSRTMREEAAALGQLIRAEDGVESAVAQLKAWDLLDAPDLAVR